MCGPALDLYQGIVFFGFICVGTWYGEDAFDVRVSVAAVTPGQRSCLKLCGLRCFLTEWPETAGNSRVRMNVCLCRLQFSLLLKYLHKNVIFLWKMGLVIIKMSEYVFDAIYFKTIFINFTFSSYSHNDPLRYSYAIKLSK